MITVPVPDTYADSHINSTSMTGHADCRWGRSMSSVDIMLITCKKKCAIKKLNVQPFVLLHEISDVHTQYHEIFVMSKTFLDSLHNAVYNRKF